VAFLGRSNVGKSSLLNALAGVKGLAHVSSKPGRTRLVNFFRVGNELYLADLPGYGYARVSEDVRRGWEALVRSYLEGRKELALCVFLVDGRHEAQENDLFLQEYLDEGEYPYVVAATKTDDVAKGALGARMEALSRAFGGAEVVPVSATTGAGLRELWNTIRAAASRLRKGEGNDGR